MTGPVILRQDFDKALEAARGVAVRPSLPGLSAPLNVTLAGSVNRVWGRIEQALEDAFTYGRERGQDVANSALASIEELLEQAGDRAGDAQQALLLRMQAYVRALVDRALSHVQDVVAAGGNVFTLDSIDLAEKLTLTGSLKTNLLDMLALTAGGELSITAKYKKQGQLPVN